jgi:hypothetical protein
MKQTATTNHSISETEAALATALEAVRHKVSFRLGEKGPGLWVDAKSCYGHMAEELNKEFVDAMHADDMGGMHNEALDIAVAAIWTLASIAADEPKAVQ